MGGWKYGSVSIVTKPVHGTSRIQLENLGTMNTLDSYDTYASLIETLSEEERDMLRGQSEEFKLSKNETIFKIGQSASHVYIVKKGRVKISTIGSDSKEVLKNLVHEGELLGEGALFEDRTRRDTASAMDSNVVVCRFPADVIRALMQKNPSLSFKITRQIAQKLRNAERRLESLTFQNSRTRIIEFLKDTAHKQGKKIGYETLLRPFLTHQDIGNLTTTSRQTVSSVLNELKGSNKIYYDRHRLLIRDISGL